MTSPSAERTAQSKPPLRIGVVLTSERVSAWIHELLFAIERAPFADLRAMVVVPSNPPRRDGAGDLLLRTFEKLDARFLARSRDAFGEFEISTGLTDLPRSTVATSAEAAHVLAAAGGLDVVLAFGVETTGLAQCARRGAWSVVFGDLLDSQGMAPYFWELHDQRPVTSVALVDDQGRVLYRSYSATEPVSLRRNANTAAWKIARATLLRLQELHAVGEESLHARSAIATTGGEAASDRRVHVRHVVRVLATVLRSAFRRVVVWRLYGVEWFVAYRPDPGWPPWSSGAPYRLLDTRGGFFADPFLVEHDGRHFLFVEDYRNSRGKAVISYLELGREGPVGERQVVLERDYHLSYPFVFERDGTIFMIPESSAARCVELFRADPFPDRWVSERVLMSDVVADDATLLQHDGRFWLFVNIPADGTATVDGELFLFWSRDLGSDWVPHPGNPVVADVRSARPAGRIFRHDGALIRPSQDNSIRYGYATVLNRIEVLTETEYREVPVARIDASWIAGNLGTHTYNRDSDYEVVDGYRRFSRLRLLRRI
jgi:hypothetical protein